MLKNISENYLNENIYDKINSIKINFEKYLTKEKLFQKNVQLLINQDGTDKSIEDEAQVKSYLEQYGITAKDLDSYYDEIVNQKVLKDWCSIYDSKYSPTNYGEVKVETQWENW